MGSALFYRITSNERPGRSFFQKVQEGGAHSRGALIRGRRSFFSCQRDFLMWQKLIVFNVILVKILAKPIKFYFKHVGTLLYYIEIKFPTFSFHLEFMDLWIVVMEV